MNEEISTYMNKVLKLIEAWEEAKTEVVAKDLNLMLTMVKLLIKSNEFDELPAFKRYLDETTEWLVGKKQTPYAAYSEQWGNLDEAKLKANGIEIVR